MDTNNLFRKSGPYILAVVLFLVISLLYFSPVKKKKKLQSSDGTQFKGMAKEIVDYREATGKEALWSNNMFSGMLLHELEPSFVIYCTLDHTSLLYRFFGVVRDDISFFLHVIYFNTCARLWKDQYTYVVLL